MDFFSLPFRLFGKGFEEFMRDWERMMEEFFEDLSVPQRMVRERKLSDGTTIREMGPLVYGFSIKIGPDGKPEIKTFGDLKPSIPRRPWHPPVDLREEREPLVDIIEGDADVRVVAEVPGVEKEDIKVYATEKSLTIDVAAKERRYYKELDLPAEVDPTNAKSTYRNGVLEVTLAKKAKERKPKGESIPID
jgi:HSP20 family protein